MGDMRLISSPKDVQLFTSFGALMACFVLASASATASVVPISSSLELHTYVSVGSIGAAPFVIESPMVSQGTTLSPLAVSAPTSLTNSTNGTVLTADESWLATFADAAHGTVTITDLGFSATGNTPGAILFNRGVDPVTGDFTNVDNGFFYSFIPDTDGNVIVTSTAAFSGGQIPNGTSVALNQGKRPDAGFFFLGMQFPIDASGTCSFHDCQSQFQLPVSAGQPYTLALINWSNVFGGLSPSIELHFNEIISFSIQPRTADTPEPSTLLLIVGPVMMFAILRSGSSYASTREQRATPRALRKSASEVRGVQNIIASLGKAACRK